MTAKFEVKKNKTGQFIFNLKAPNGKTILTSEPFKIKNDIIRRIKAVKRNAIIDAAYERKASNKKKLYFVLKSTNRHIIGKSEMYSTTIGMEKGIASVKTNAPKAVIKDWTI